MGHCQIYSSGCRCRCYILQPREWYFETLIATQLHFYVHINSGPCTHLSCYPYDTVSLNSYQLGHSHPMKHTRKPSNILNYGTCISSWEKWRATGTCSQINQRHMTSPDEHILQIDQWCPFTCLLRIFGHRPLGYLHEFWRHNITFFKDVSGALRERGIWIPVQWISLQPGYIWGLRKPADHGLSGMLLAYVWSQVLIAHMCSDLLA